jgi:hypothetical protein
MFEKLKATPPAGGHGLRDWKLGGFDPKYTHLATRKQEISAAGTAATIAAQPQIQRDALRALLSYYPESGDFIWNVAVNSRAQPSSIAGSLNQDGYLQIGIDGRRYYAHRLAWLHFYGELPTHGIDHINGDRADNRIANLRLATHAQNAANAKRCRTNRSGLKGVSSSHGKWRARISPKGKCLGLGTFNSPEDAHAAYVATAQSEFGKFWRAA